MPLARHRALVEDVRDLEEDARAVPRQRVRPARAAVRHARQDLEPQLDDVVAGLAAEVGHEAGPAGVVLERGVVEAAGARQRHARAAV